MRIWHKTKSYVKYNDLYPQILNQIETLESNQFGVFHGTDWLSVIGQLHLLINNRSTLICHSILPCNETKIDQYKIIAAVDVLLIVTLIDTFL